MSLTAPETLHRFRNAARIERKADSIADPIGRLKYLRQATAFHAPASVRRRWGPIASLCMVVLLLSMRSDAHLRHPLDISRAARVLRVVKQDLPQVWIVENTREYEVYSNGLRIENQLAVSNKP